MLKGDKPCEKVKCLITDSISPVLAVVSLGAFTAQSSRQIPGTWAGPWSRRQASLRASTSFLQLARSVLSLRRALAKFTGRGRLDICVASEMHSETLHRKDRSGWVVWARGGMRAAANCEGPCRCGGVTRHDLWSRARSFLHQVECQRSTSRCLDSLRGPAGTGRSLPQPWPQKKPISRKMNDLDSFGCISSCAQKQLRAQGVRSPALSQKPLRPPPRVGLRGWRPLEPSPGYHRRQGALNPSAAVLLKLLSFSCISPCFHCARALPHLRTSGRALARVGAREDSDISKRQAIKSSCASLATDQYSDKDPKADVAKHSSKKLVMIRSPVPPSFLQFSRLMFSLREGLAKFEDARPKSFWRTNRLTCRPRCSAFLLILHPRRLFTLDAIEDKIVALIVLPDVWVEVWQRFLS